MVKKRPLNYARRLALQSALRDDQHSASLTHEEHVVSVGVMGCESENTPRGGTPWRPALVTSNRRGPSIYSCKQPMLDNALLPYPYPSIDEADNLISWRQECILEVSRRSRPYIYSCSHRETRERRNKKLNRKKLLKINFTCCNECR
jgi:hypothetical protein